MTSPTEALKSLLFRMTYPIIYVHEDDIEAPQRIAEAVLNGTSYSEPPAEFRDKIRALLDSGINMGFDENHTDAGVRKFFRAVLDLLDKPRPWPEFDLQRIRNNPSDLYEAPVIGHLEMNGHAVKAILQRPFDRSWRGGVGFTDENLREIMPLQLRTGQRLALRAKPTAVEGIVEVLSPDPPDETIANFEAFTGIAVTRTTSTLEP